MSRLQTLAPLTRPLRRPIAEGWVILAPLVFVAVAAGRRTRLRVAAMIAAGTVAAALRDPERRPAATDDALAPADGRVVAIETVFDEYFGVEMLEIAIFLALWHVHVQRAPLAGRVVALKTFGSGFRPAFRSTAAHNVRRATYLETAWGPCVVTQIAGLIARRIVQWVELGDKVAAGQRIGMIKFGSRVTVRLPIGSVPLVRIDQEVRAGLTPIARQPG